MIDERIDIKEEGFLENIEDSYYFINEVNYNLYHSCFDFPITVLIFHFPIFIFSVFINTEDYTRWETLLIYQLQQLQLQSL